MSSPHANGEHIELHFNKIKILTVRSLLCSIFYNKTPVARLQRHLLAISLLFCVRASFIIRKKKNKLGGTTLGVEDVYNPDIIHMYMLDTVLQILHRSLRTRGVVGGA